MWDAVWDFICEMLCESLCEILCESLCEILCEVLCSMFCTFGTMFNVYMWYRFSWTLCPVLVTCSGGSPRGCDAVMRSNNIIMQNHVSNLPHTLFKATANVYPVEGRGYVTSWRMGGDAQNKFLRRSRRFITAIKTEREVKCSFISALVHPSCSWPIFLELQRHSNTLRWHRDMKIKTS